MSPEPPPAMAERVALILDAFGDSPAALSVSDLAARVGLARSTTHRIVQQLIAVGFLERIDERVQLGLKLFELGQRVPTQRTLQSATSPFLQDLRDATRHTANLAILDGGDMVYVDRAPTANAPALPFRLGGRHPAHATAMGKAMLAHLPADELQRLLERELVPVTPRTITDPDALASVLAETRRTGLAVDMGETRAGVNCVASPVFSRTGGVVGAISITGLEQAAVLTRWGPVVRNAALNLSRALRTTTLTARR